MKLEQFVQLVKEPNLLNEQHIAELEQIIRTYPYFQSAQLLYAKALNNTNHIQYHQVLKKAAIIAGDRRVLYHLIHKKEIVAATEETDKSSIVTTIYNSQEKKQAVDVEKEKQEADEQEQKILQAIVELSHFNFSSPKMSELIFEPVSPESQEVKEHDEQSLSREEVKKMVIPGPDYTKNETNIDEVVATQVVTAFVEKEVLKVTEVEKPKAAEESSKEGGEEIEKSRSFQDWLRNCRTEKQPEPDNSQKKEELIAKPTKDTTEKPKEKQGEEAVLAPRKQTTTKSRIIDEVIKKEPRISPINPDKQFYSAVSTAKNSILEDEGLVTETLAKIYAAQGNYNKAIRAYEILCLKFPEKSVYFASLMNEIKAKLK